MTNSECVALLQWALPRLNLRWAGFRRVRRQVCRRIRSRIGTLRLAGFDGYRRYLEDHDEEWKVLDGFCRISISRFYRDGSVFDTLRETVLPEIFSLARAEGHAIVRFWSAGCASGEEVYTLSALLESAPQRRSDVRRHILGTDVDPHLIHRARRACYPASSVKDFPKEWLAKVFTESEKGYCVREDFRADVDFLLQDIRSELPPGPFHLVLCRNLAFTYFDADLQLRILKGIDERILPGGFLVIGSHEALPACPPQLRSFGGHEKAGGPRLRHDIFRAAGPPSSTCVSR